MGAMRTVDESPRAVSTAWHAIDASEAFSRLDSGMEGLTAAAARERLAEHGPNTIQRARREGPLALVWRQIDNPLIWVLLGSSVLAMVVDPQDGIKNGAVILAVVILNTLIGFIQELRAGRAIEALIQMVPESATAIRDGVKVVLPTADLVPGDVVLLASGDKVPADMRLVQMHNLQIQEAALTGESVPTRKQIGAVDEQAGVGDRLCMAFGGTLVTYGTGTAVVVATGSSTELGRISTMLEETTDLQTPLTKAMAVIGRYITIAVVAVSLVMLVVGTVRTMGQGMTMIAALKETVIFAIALAVGAIPEGLPAIVTIALAIGVQRMAARRAVIRKLPAVETLGSTTVICSDKTGTLTSNEMTVQALWTPQGVFEVTGVGYDPHGQLSRDGVPVEGPPDDVRALLLDAALCNDAALRCEDGHWKVTGDPTEGALVVAAEKLGIEVEKAQGQHPRVGAIPFESENQFMATLHDDPQSGHQRVILKGAPEVVLERCDRASGGGPLDSAAVLREVERLAAAGMRVLAIASTTPRTRLGELEMEDVAGGLELVGLQGMIDPPRAEAIQAIEACHAAGILVKMITGDHEGTARAIGKQLGLTRDGRSVNGTQLARMNDDELRRAALDVNVFARVAPEHKLRLVRALQQENHVVAMTGDGVNDAPALKQANIGVAMGITGTAVSKEAADIVLTDDNFASIAAAVEEGRRVYDNLIKSLAFVLPTNLGLAFILMFAVMFFPYGATGELLLPILPTQLLWINLVATVALALPLAFESKEPDVMRRPPRKPDEPVLTGFVIMRTIVVALLMTAGAVGLFHWEYTTELGRGMAPDIALREAQTMAVTAVIMFQIFYMMNCRSLRDSVLRIGLVSNRTVFIGIVALLLLQLGFMYLPFMNAIFGTAGLDLDAWIKSVLVGAIVLPVIGLEKWLRQRAARSRAAGAPAYWRRAGRGTRA
jgi:magnesium-transporting ATPase (P-type)